jgi:arylformamidase
MPVVVDLSQIIEPGMPVFPGTPLPVIQEVSYLIKDGFKESLFSFYSHIGTHLDVPAHIFQNGKSVEMFDCSKFFGTSIIIDCSSSSKIDLHLVKQAYSSSNKPDFIIFYTGWSDYWGSEKYFRDFPVLSAEAAKYISSLPVKGLGIDALSFDAMGEDNLANHKILLEKEIILIENLCSLNQVPKENFYFSCLPLKIAYADGAPTRACAILT